MLKKASTKETKELPIISKEDFLDRFYDGKVIYKLPNKYPENFALCSSYMEGKKEIPLAHRDKVGTILRDAYHALKPIIKKFRLHLGLLIESAVHCKGVAWTKKIKIDFSMPGVSGSKEEIVAFTSMVQIKIRDPKFPQNPKKFLNKTTVLAILLHELAHIRHMHHGIRFALFLRQLYEYAMMLGIFPEGEEIMLPSSRQWERRMFETRGKMTIDELQYFFEIHPATDDNEDHHDERVSDYEQKETTNERRETLPLLERKDTNQNTTSQPPPRKRKLFEEDAKPAAKKRLENKKTEKPKLKPKRPERLERSEKTERPARPERVERSRTGAQAAAAEGKVVVITKRRAVSMKPRALSETMKPVKKIITIAANDLKEKGIVKVVEPCKTMETMERRASTDNSTVIVIVEEKSEEKEVEPIIENVEMEVSEAVVGFEENNGLGNIGKICEISIPVAVNA